MWPGAGSGPTAKGETASLAIPSFQTAIRDNLSERRLGRNHSMLWAQASNLGDQMHKKISWLIALVLAATVISGASPAVALKSQKITFPYPKSMILGQPDQPLLAKSSSKLKIAYVVTTKQVCKVTGQKISALMTGQCVVTATQKGNSSFARAKSITRVFMIGATTAVQSQTINFSQPSALKVGAPGQLLVATSSSNLAVTLVSNTPGICQVNGNQVLAKAPGACIISATQEGDSKYLPAPIVQRVFQILGMNALATGSTTQSGLKCTILGTESNDTITGTDGDDVICGFGGDDLISGLGGNDVIDAGFGDDVLSGGLGNDTLDGNQGTDTADFAGASSVNANLNTDQATGAGSDNLPGIENLTGSDGADTLTGDASTNIISGGEGADNINGNGSNDQLNGQGGTDTIKGGDGDDTIRGGQGNDNLTGDNGNDNVNGDEGVNTCYIESTEFRDETCQLLPLLSHLFARVSGKFNNWNPAFTGCYLVYADYFYGGTIRALIPIQADGTYQFDTLPVSNKWVRIMSKAASRSGGYPAPDATCPFHAGGYSSSTVVTASITKGADNYIEHTLPDFVSITVSTVNDLSAEIPNAQFWCSPGLNGTYPFEDIVKVPGGSGLGSGLFTLTQSCGDSQNIQRTDSSGNFTFLAVKGEKLTLYGRVSIAGASLDSSVFITADTTKSVDIVFGP